MSMEFLVATRDVVDDPSIMIVVFAKRPRLGARADDLLEAECCDGIRAGCPTSWDEAG